VKVFIFLAFLLISFELPAFHRILYFLENVVKKGSLKFLFICFRSEIRLGERKLKLSCQRGGSRSSDLSFLDLICLFVLNQESVIVWFGVFIRLFFPWMWNFSA